ncbi:hypothetical protein D3C73_1398610 [compost metagenome]
MDYAGRGGSADRCCHSCVKPGGGKGGHCVYARHYFRAGFLCGADAAYAPFRHALKRAGAAEAGGTGAGLPPPGGRRYEAADRRAAGGEADDRGVRGKKAAA